MKQFFADIFEHLLLMFMVALVLSPVILIGSFLKSCSPEEQAMKRAEAEAERIAEEEAELERIGRIYNRVYDEANDAFWNLANMYEDLYYTYSNDPGRTGSLDGFIEPGYIDGPLPDEVSYFLDD